MKVHIYKDEYYPFYDFIDSPSPAYMTVEMSEAIYKTIKEVMDDFKITQNTLEAYFNSEK